MNDAARKLTHHNIPVRMLKAAQEFSQVKVHSGTEPAPAIQGVYVLPNPGGTPERFYVATDSYVLIALAEGEHSPEELLNALHGATLEDAAFVGNDALTPMLKLAGRLYGHETVGIEDGLVFGDHTFEYDANHGIPKVTSIFPKEFGKRRMGQGINADRMEKIAKLAKILAPGKNNALTVANFGRTDRTDKRLGGNHPELMHFNADRVHGQESSGLIAVMGLSKNVGGPTQVNWGAGTVPGIVNLEEI